MRTSERVLTLAFVQYLADHSKQRLIEDGFSEKVIAMVEIIAATCDNETDPQTLSMQFRLPVLTCRRLLLLHKDSLTLEMA